MNQDPRWETIKRGDKFKLGGSVNTVLAVDRSEGDVPVVAHQSAIGGFGVTPLEDLKAEAKIVDSDFPARVFVKMPVTVEALQFYPMDWISGHRIPGVERIEKYNDEWRGVVNTLEGVAYASSGDWVVKGTKGEFYPVKPDIFEETYEELI